MGQELSRDGHHLTLRLALAEDHFRKSLAQRAMVIDGGKPQIGERQRGQAPDRLVDRDTAGPHLAKQLLNKLPIHRARAATSLTRLWPIVP